MTGELSQENITSKTKEASRSLSMHNWITRAKEGIEGSTAECSILHQYYNYHYDHWEQLAMFLQSFLILG